jgi:NAD(P)-dependent dehydrogenase (short-subunit alcohol dehydrogenase family)
MNGLDDKVALVTGAGSGIGRASARRLAAEGAAVALLDFNPDSGEQAAAEIRDAGGRAVAVLADATNADQIAAAISRTEEEFGRLDILVNAVVFVMRKNIFELEMDEWYRTIDGSLNSYFLLIKLALPALIRAGAGKIINICSIAAHVGYGVPAYTAAKGAILSMTRELAAELAPHRININSVSPGVIETGLNRDTLGDPEIRERTIALTPWGRLGTPDDIAGPVAFLASSDADYITGTDLVVDGAMSCTIAWGTVSDRLRSFHAQGENPDATGA